MTAGKTALFFKTAIEKSGLTQPEIARRAGFPQPNVSSMTKTGYTKVPIDRTPTLADTLGVSALDFLRIAMRQYQPAVWDVLTKPLMRR